MLTFPPMFRAFLVLAPVIAALLIQGCGFKGPLALPPEEPAKKPAAAPAPAPASGPGSAAP